MARPAEVNAVAAFRRLKRVILCDLAPAFGKSQGWLSYALRGDYPLTSDDCKRLRELIEQLSGKASETKEGEAA